MSDEDFTVVKAVLDSHEAPTCTAVTVAMTPHDPELAAIALCVSALDGFNIEARARIIRYLAERHEMQAGI